MEACSNRRVSRYNFAIQTSLNKYEMSLFPLHFQLMQTSRLNNRWYVHDISDCKVLLEVNSTVLTFSSGTLVGASMVVEEQAWTWSSGGLAYT